MPNAAEQKPPNGITLEDLDKQTEQVKAAFTEQIESVRIDSVQQVAQVETDHKIALLMEQLGANEAAAKIEVDRKFNKYFMFLVFAFLFLLAIGAINYFQVLNPQAGESVFELGEVELLGVSELCPGDSLRFLVNVKVVEAGVYRLAMSTWRIAPLPATYVFSEGLDMVIAEARDFPIEIEWVIPESYLSLATGKNEKWPEGEFSRDIAVTATGRNTSSSTRKVPFTIRSECGVSP